ncbi:MAG: DUF4157 domain-containing protein [Gilvibacter sp.]
MPNYKQDKAQEQKSAQLNSVRQRQTKGESKGAFLEDNRPKAVIQKKENNTGMPDQLKSGIESLSGLDMSDTKVHYNSDKPAQLNAHAYAQGSDIHLASGQEKHLPHEAWHVVQQKQGRVKPTMQMKGKVNINDDQGLEKEADVMGEKALTIVEEQGAIQRKIERLSLQTTLGQSIVQRVVTITAGDVTLSTEELVLKALEKYKNVMALSPSLSDIIQKTLSFFSNSGLTFEDENELWETLDREVVKYNNAQDEQQAILDDPESGELTYTNFRRRNRIQSTASKLTQQIGPATVLGPDSALKPNGPIAYVANILTTPSGASVQSIIDSYAATGVSRENYGDFAMVIGVNLYRSLNGNSASKIADAVKAASEAPFPCAIIPFMWDFLWNAPFKVVQGEFKELSPGGKKLALATEKENLKQSVIPYGQLREKVTASKFTSQFVNELQKTHKAVYVHLGDDDAKSLLPSGTGKPLMDSYTDTILDARLPQMVVGGYEFRTKASGGDLDDDSSTDVLTALASQIDIWFRSILTEINPDLVYATEPNMAFLASTKERNFLEELTTPGKQDQRRLTSEMREAMDFEGESLEVEPELSTGLLYGRGANEGGKLRENIKGLLYGKTKNTKPVTKYDPRLGIATASDRFTLGSDDRIGHDKRNPSYGSQRSSALDVSPEALENQVVLDVLTIKQSHIGGLKKEIQKFDPKNKDLIGDAVLAAVKAVLLGQPQPKYPEVAEPFIRLIQARSGQLNAIKIKLNKIITDIMIDLI